MALVKRLVAKKASCYVHRTSAKNLCFELPAELYGRNHRVPSFSAPPRPVRFCVPWASRESIDAVFVSSSESLGVFFLSRRIPVYVTEPVYEQLKMKLKFYQALTTSYDDEETIGCFVRDLADAKCPAVVKISLNQSFAFDLVTVRAVSAGSFLGWVNFYVKDLYNFLYAKSLSTDARFSAPPPDVPVDFLFLNRDTDKNCFARCACDSSAPKTKVVLRPGHIPGISASPDEDTKVRVVERAVERRVLFGIEPFTQHIAKGKHQKVVVLCDFATCLLEIMLHAFYVLKDTPIFVLGDGFPAYKSRLVYMGEFLNSSFRSRIYKGADPLPLSFYANLHAISHVSEITHQNYVLFAEQNPFTHDQDVLCINSLSAPTCFFIPFEDTLEKIDKAFGSVILLNEEYRARAHSCVFHTTSALEMDSVCVRNPDSVDTRSVAAGESYFIDTEASKMTIEIRNSDLVVVQNAQMLVEGKLEYTDRYRSNVHRLILTAKNPTIKELFEKERFYFLDGFYFFPEAGYKVSLETKPHVRRLH